MTSACGLVRFVSLCTLLLLLGCGGSGDEISGGSDAAGLRFAIAEGSAANHFVRQNGISAHLNLQTHPVPRLIVAFPAGNSGGALFFQRTLDERVWGDVANLQTIETADAKGRRLYGLQADISIESAELSLEEADVGSVRFLRKAVDYSALPPRPGIAMHVDGNQIHISRERPDGKSSYALELEVLAGVLQAGHRPRLVASEDGALKIRIRVLSGDALEIPVSADALVTDAAASNAALENALAFLTYDKKMLAGSWRFLTYFGRDTLLSLRLLMPVLAPAAAEIGLGAVLERVNEHGEVAHEEEIGELAVYRNIAEHGRASAGPVYDYNMVDDNLMLLPVLENYAETFGADRATRFLAGQTSVAEPLARLVARNLRLVVGQAAAFVEHPAPQNLIAIKEGLNVGNWRDSQEGLVGGRYAYDVNAVLMPSALYAAADIVDAGLLGRHASDLPGAAELRQMADVWAAHAPEFFDVAVSASSVEPALQRYAQARGLPVDSVSRTDVRFAAVALNEDFEPIPVMHSDSALELLFLQSPEQRLKSILTILQTPYPAGLATAVGILAANPAYAPPEAQALVTRNHYHGTVIWSWQQAMIIAGIDEQLRRDDISDALRVQLRETRQGIWEALAASDDYLNSELWSFEVRDGEFVITPFGQSEGHLTESNAIQLWSTVFLALRPAG